MRRVALFLAACAAVVSAIGLYAQQTDSIASTNNPPAVSQPVPRLIMLNGSVKDLAGKPLTGPVDLDFAIYKEQTDAAPLWQESQTLNVDEQGHYAALLGAMQAEGLPVDLFTSGEARWLGVSAGKLPEQPRVLLVSVPYALKANDAEMLGGKPASAYALAPPAESTTSPGTGTAGAAGPRGAATPDVAAPGTAKSGPKPNVAGTGTQNYIPVWTNSTGTLGNSVMYQSGSNVGIGTTTPVGLLDVGGSAGDFRVNSSGVAVEFTRAGGNFVHAITAGGYLSFVVNGNARLDATSSLKLDTNGNAYFPLGNVGIGTTTPTGLLDVAGPSGHFRVTKSGLAVEFSRPSANYIHASTAGGYFDFVVNGNPVSDASSSLKLDANGNVYFPLGNVGIGTMTPAAKLDVAGSVGHFQVDTSGAEFRFTRGGANYFLASTAGGYFDFVVNGKTPSDANTSIKLAVNGDVDFMAGRVGIGTATPAHALDVVGDINASTNIKAGGNLSVTGTISGNGSGLTNVSGTNASNVTCTGCVTGADIASGTITGAKVAAGTITGSNIASGTITGANVSPTAGITPAAIAGTAATLGSNTFVGNQTITGGLSVTANQTVTGNLNLSGTLNGWTITPNMSNGCSVFGQSNVTCKSANLQGGYTGSDAQNSVASGVVGGTIAGGGGLVNATSYSHTVSNHFATVLGGALNQAGDNSGPTSASCCQSVSGGLANVASGDRTHVGGGYNNIASASFASVAGGQKNNASGQEAAIAGGGVNKASGSDSAIAGGSQNLASGPFSTVAGGNSNTASGIQSFAAGCQANAANAGTFVWSGSLSASCTTVSSSAAGQFLALAPGGVIFYSNTALSAGVSLAAGGGSWGSVSDRNVKANFVPVIGENLLARLNAMPMTTWNYKAQEPRFRHLGPMAQDFYGAFGLGEDDKHIDDIDGQGVALAGVQALYRLSLKKDAELQKQQGQIRTLTLQVQELEKEQRRMATLEARLAEIEARTSKPQTRSVTRTAPAKPAPGSTTLAKAQF